MKYFYISCFLLSSFFTYKTLSAKDNYSQYAFFMPQGAFEQNISLGNIESMRPRQPKIAEQTSSKQIQKETTEPKITLPYVKRKIKLQDTPISDKIKETSLAAPEISDNIPSKAKESAKQAATPTPVPLTISPETMEKLKKYSLEGTSPEKTEDKTTQEKISLVAKSPTQKDLIKMLSSVPYPNPALPKFKQIYASYVMDLRIFNRRGNLPANPEQEQTLQKANSNRRFEVK